MHEDDSDKETNQEGASAKVTEGMLVEERKRGGYEC